MNEIHETSLFDLATVLLRGRWRIVRWALGGAVLAALSVIARPRLYEASASFTPVGGDASRSGLASIAGQFGVTLPGSNQSLSPDFYSALLQSRVVLLDVVRDTFVVSEEGNRRTSFADLFRIDGASAAEREEQAVRSLKDMIEPGIAKTTGVVSVKVRTRWPSVSYAIVDDLVKGIDDYNQRTRQTQAASERKFLEARLAAVGADLRAAEAKMLDFLKTNRQIGSSPELSFERERLSRDLTLQQTVHASLTQSYEDAKIREVRDTPLISLVEPPQLPVIPEPRGRIKQTVLGFVLGGMLGMIVVFASSLLRRARETRSVEVERFFEALQGMRWPRRISRRAGTSA